MGKDLFTEIRVKYNTLSKNQKLVANYILENRNRCVRMTLSELGKECSLSETTIIRFINKLDYTSYQDFRLDMAQDLSRQDVEEREETTKDYQDIKSDDSIEEIKQKVISIASSAIYDINKLVDLDRVTDATKLIEKAKRIMFFGAGGSGVIATDVYHKFLRCGKNVINESNSHIALIHASQLTADDLLILISHEGESKEVLECGKLAQKRGAKVLGITSYMNSDLAKLADLCIFSSTNDSAYYTDAMVSRLVQLVIMDMLFIIISTRADEGHVLKAMEASRLATMEMKIHNEEE
ncbi:MAG: MurR/RpiR family transcriptional regulator [Lachnospiraceae bacterium]|nr:MurR/RpiR family transcriptional regulator [Lachnospiraceae bacterium]